MAATLNCEQGRHTDCGGYIAPLVYSATRPCSCDCHATLGRDYRAAEARAERSFYGPNLERAPEWVRRARANALPLRDETNLRGYVL